MTRRPAVLAAASIAVLATAVGLLVAARAPSTSPTAARTTPTPAALPPSSAAAAPSPSPPTAVTTAPSTALQTTPAPRPRRAEPAAATTPTGLADQLRSAAAAITAPSTPPDRLAAAAHLQQVAVRALVDQPSLREPTYARLAPALRTAVTADVAAGAALRAMVRKPKTTLPRWRIVAPPPEAELMGHYRAAEREFGVPWRYLAAIHLVETRMGRIRGTSSAGAQGPMQFMPATWRAYGEGDINSPRDSIRAAARYLRASGAPQRMRKAVYAYNHSDHYVDAVLSYAERMRNDPRAYAGYHGWQVYYVMDTGPRWLPEGFDNT